MTGFNQLLPFLLRWVDASEMQKAQLKSYVLLLKS